MKYSYTLKEKNGIKYISFPSFDKTNFVNCIFSTRCGGISPSPYDTLNLGFTTNDKIENVKINREKFSKIIRNPFQNPILQTHSNSVISVKKNAKQNNILGAADALITNKPDIPLTILVADCFVVFILDPIKKAIAAIHCGWRGAAKNIIGETIKKMSLEYNVKPQDCLAAVSPGIGICCFLVNKDIYNEFNNVYPQWKDLYLQNKKQWFIDLNKIILRLLLAEGIKEENISGCDLCTSCKTDLFYSYRRDKKDTGRMAGVIMMQ